MPDQTNTPPALELQHISKRFPGVLALDDISFDLRPGEVHCLVGENGAGKSTLMKIIAGAEHSDAGEIRLAGKPVRIQSPHHAQELGVSMIYQEFNLSPYLNVAENIFLGREPRHGRSPFLDHGRMRREAQALLKRVGVTMDVSRPVRECSVAEQQMIEIAKALSFDSKIIVMDEPSATLTDHELITLFNLIRELRDQGIGLVYISHRLEEIFQIGDRVTVMRDGKHIDTRLVADTTRMEIIQRMVGRDLTEEFPKHAFERGKEMLRVEGLTRAGQFEDVSFNLYTGEIAGLTGLVGAGRTEVARALFGADPVDAGSIHIDGQPARLRSPRAAIDQGIGLLTEDRKNQGLVLGMSVRENATLANLDAVTRGGFLSGRLERGEVSRLVDELTIKTPNIEQTVQNLSGGNQQKVVLAKWLFTECRVLIFDEPTRGVDVGAKVEIYKLMNALVQKGVAVLIISSELPEVLGMCDRILVMHEGKLAGELGRWEATQEKIMELATGAPALIGQS